MAAKVMEKLKVEDWKQGSGIGWSDCLPLVAGKQELGIGRSDNLNIHILIVGY
jgi:hypothetical protein